MQGCMILSSIGTEKDTLVFYSAQIVDGRMEGQTDRRTDGQMDGKLNPYITPC